MRAWDEESDVQMGHQTRGGAKRLLEARKSSFQFGNPALVVQTTLNHWARPKPADGKRKTLYFRRDTCCGKSLPSLRALALIDKAMAEVRTLKPRI